MEDDEEAKEEEVVEMITNLFKIKFAYHAYYFNLKVIKF